MGGFYERWVGMVKSTLGMAIQRKFLTTTQSGIYATECEHILNSRLLVHVDGDIRSTEAITPNHFLCLNPRNLVLILKDDGNPDFNPIQDGLFWGFSRMGGGGAFWPPLPKICHTNHTMRKLGTVITYQRKIQKMYKSRDTPLGFC